MDWNRIKEKYKNNKTELVLFLLFICFFLFLTVPEAAREALRILLRSKRKR